MSLPPAFLGLLCFWILEGPSPSLSDLFRSKVSLSDEVPCWDESVLLPFAPSSSPPNVSSAHCRLLNGFPPVLSPGFLFWKLPFFLRPSVAFGFSLRLRPPPWLPVTFCWVVSFAALFLDSPRFGRPGLLCCFHLSSPFSSRFPPWDLLPVPSFVGFSIWCLSLFLFPVVLSRLVPLG